MIIKEAISHYYNNPYHFVKDIIQVTPTPQQKSVLTALQNHKAISVKSGHGIGKTAVQSWVILWFMFTRPFCKVPCTAPTQHQLYDVLWAELNKWVERSKIKEFFDWTQTHLYNKNNPHNWFAVARSCNKPDNMQGFHADELLFVIDEASGVPQDIMEVVEGALTNEGAYCLMCGNPTQLSGTFFNSFHKDRKFWDCHTFSCLNSPLVSKDYVERMKGKYGEDSNIYKVRVLGEFPSMSDDNLISLSDVETSVSNDFPAEEEMSVCIGVDVARFGDDKTVIISRQGKKVLNLTMLSKKSTMETVGYIMVEINKHKNVNVSVLVDDSGVGGGVTDRLNELNNRTNVFIIPLNNGSRAVNHEKFVNRGCELWWNIRENISSWDVPDDEELVGELTTRKYCMTSTGKIQIERKEDMKKRGLPSPDKADALSLAFAEEISTEFVLDY